MLRVLWSRADFLLIHLVPFSSLPFQQHMFEQSLGSLATHPVWRSMLQRMHRCIQKCALRGGDVSEELRDLITSDGMNTTQRLLVFLRVWGAMVRVGT